MAAKKEAIKLPKAEDVPSAKVFLEAKNSQGAKVAKLRQAVTTDGKFNKYDPKYRQSLKKLKRAQRALHKELDRVKNAFKPKEEVKAEA